MPLEKLVISINVAVEDIHNSSAGVREATTETKSTNSEVRSPPGEKGKGEDPQIWIQAFLHGSHKFQCVQNIRKLALNCQSK